MLSPSLLVAAYADGYFPMGLDDGTEEGWYSVLLFRGRLVQGHVANESFLSLDDRGRPPQLLRRDISKPLQRTPVRLRIGIDSAHGGVHRVRAQQDPPDRPSLNQVGQRAIELPALTEVRCYDLFSEARERFIADMQAQFPALRFETCATAPDAVRPADVVVTAVPIVVAPTPDLDAGMLKAGGLAVSLDYDSAWTGAAMQECDKFCSDDIGQLLSTKEHGVYFGGIPAAISADLGELAAGLKPGRETDGERIFSMNMGIAVDDMVTAKVLYERALERGAGVRLPL